MGYLIYFIPKTKFIFNSSYSRIVSSRCGAEMLSWPCPTYHSTLPTKRRRYIALSEDNTLSMMSNVTLQWYRDIWRQMRHWDIAMTSSDVFDVKWYHLIFDVIATGLCMGLYKARFLWRHTPSRPMKMPHILYNARPCKYPGNNTLYYTLWLTILNIQYYNYTLVKNINITYKHIKNK